MQSKVLLLSGVLFVLRMLASQRATIFTFHLLHGHDEL